MKSLLFISVIIAFCASANAQNNGPKEVTPQKLASINAEVDGMTAAFKKTNSVNGRSVHELEFITDTFRIERLYAKVIDIDYSTAGMRNATNTRRQEYDELLNKYYSKLLKLLKPADRKTLIAAQRSWISYRDNENKLIGVMMNDKYSGGGTMQQIVATTRGADIVVSRACAIARYYIDAADNK